MFRIALAQINTTVGDFEGNCEKILTFSRRAWRLKADLVIFPELSLPGYPPEDLLLKRSFLEANRVYLRRLAARAPNIGVICGYADWKDDKVYNAAAVIAQKQVLHSYHKMHLPNYGVFDEKRYFQPGTSVPLLLLDRIRIGFNICEDIWVEPGLCGRQAGLGAKLIVNISSSPYHLHKLDERTELLRGAARRHKCHIAYVNTVGAQDELVFDGGSTVVDSRGKMLARAQQFREQLLVVDLAASALKSDLSQESTAAPTPAAFVVNRVKIRAPRRRRQRQAIPRTLARRLPDSEEVYSALVLGTRDYINKNGFRNVIVGLSGGIDSALTTAIAVDAIGNSQVETLFMPSRFTSEVSRRAAIRQAKLLGVKMHLVPIDRLFSCYVRELQPSFKDLPEDITEENIQARIRGNLLMAFSNKFGHLVLNTANKSEAAVGYSTLYGDMVGGFAALKDIPKTMVYRICRYLNRSRRREVIAREIIRRQPSAELKANQVDSDTLPPYQTLDEILRLFVEEDRDTEEIIERGYDQHLVDWVIKKVIRAEYKRRQMAPGVKITPRAFGKDRRWPITNKF
jgi:NAD+ synthase (glutamine-hydrolysing)